MATVGQYLSAPEQGWRRIDDTNSKIIYTGTWINEGGGSHYNSTSKASTVVSSKITFKFYGTKLRIISPRHPDFPTNCIINIDNVNYTFSENYSSLQFRILCFEKIDLPEQIHTVVISFTEKKLAFDAIDIDDTGYIVNPVPVVKLLVQDGSLLKTISSGNLVTVCNTTDSDTIIENAFNTSGLNDLSLWNDTLTNQIVNSTFNIVAYRKYVE